MQIKTSTEFSFHFYMAFNNFNAMKQHFDHQMVIASADVVDVAESIYEHQDYILIDLQCENSASILYNANETLMNYLWLIVDADPFEVCPN